MQKLLFKTMMLLMVIPMNSWNAHSQNSQRAKSDSITVHRDQIRTCVKCLQNAPYKDSIIVEQQHRIEIKDSTIQIQKTIIDSAEKTVSSLDEKLVDCKKETIDLERKRKRGVKWAAGIGTAGGGILGWLLCKSIK